MINDTQGNECSNSDWDDLWEAFSGDKDQLLLSKLMGVLTHPQMVFLWCMTSVMPARWGSADARRCFPLLAYRSVEVIDEALAMLRSHPAPDRRGEP